MPLLSVFGGLFGDSAGVLFHVWCVLDIRWGGECCRSRGRVCWMLFGLNISAVYASVRCGWSWSLSALVGQTGGVRKAAFSQVSCKTQTKEWHYLNIPFISDRVNRKITTRFPHDRTKEHLTNDNSSVKKHLTTHHRNNSHNIEVKVITRENDPVNLRLYEAYYIRKHKPGLNSREECTELNDLLF